MGELGDPKPLGQQGRVKDLVRMLCGQTRDLGFLWKSLSQTADIFKEK